MIERVDRAIRTVQAAMISRRLYGEDHAATRAQERAALELIGALLKGEGQVTVKAFEDRVVWGNQTLPSSAALIEGVFHRLELQGIECVTFTRGLTAEELSGFVEQLARNESDPQPIRGSVHVRLGALSMARPGGGGATLVELDARVQAVSLERVWRGVYSGRGCDAGALEGVVSDICASVGGSAGTVLQLASLKHHDEYTYTHTINVGVLSAALGETIGLGAHDLTQLTAAALLHDMGKRVIPQKVLNKNGHLNDRELGMMRRHPAEGAKLLYDLDNVPELAPIVAYEHHMRLDGSGYPHIKPGWRIHLASQIVQIADVFDALRTNRPYRAALSVEEAKQTMMEGPGNLFDNGLLDVFFRRVVGRAAGGDPVSRGGPTSGWPSA